MGWARSRWWFLVPCLVCVTLCLLMLRGGVALYWGPHESDLTNQFYPWQVFIHRWVMRGVLPFWDPHVFSGYPTIETQQMLALNPVHLLSLLLPPELGLIAMMAGNTVIGCVAMCWALWRWGRLTALASAMGGVLYICGALFAVRVMAGHFTVVAALAWWPLAVLSVLRITRMTGGAIADFKERRGGWWRATWQQVVGAWRQFCSSPALRRLLAASAVCHAMVMLAGAPQYIAYLFYIDLAVVAALFRRGRLLTSLVLVGVAWVIALFISAPQWLPAFWYLPFTGRGINGGGNTGFTLQPLLNLWLEGIMPFPFGDDVTKGHLHFKNVWETATYPGAITLALTLAATLRWFFGMTRWTIDVRRYGRTTARRPREITPVMAGGLLLLVLGVYLMFGGWLPGFGSFREATKARAILAFAVPMIAAAVLDGALRSPKQWAWPVAAGAAGGLAMIFSTFRYDSPQAFKKLLESFGRPFDPLAIERYEFVMQYPDLAQMDFSLAIIAGSVGLIIALVAALLLRRLPRLTIAVLFIAAVADPFFAHARAWMGRHAYASAGLPPAISDYFSPFLHESEVKNTLPWRVILHSGIINRSHHLEGLYEYYGYDPLMPAYAVGRLRVPGVKLIQTKDNLAWRVPLLERVGIRYDGSLWLPPGTAHSMLKEQETTASTIIEAPGATLFDVTRNVAAGSSGQGMFGPDLQGRHLVLPRGEGSYLLSDAEAPAEFARNIAEIFPVENFPTTGPSTLQSDESITALPHLRPDEWGVHVKLDSSGLVVFKSTWLPGWRVVIDGKDAGTALFANNWMCAAIVPAGEHDVVFRYRPVGWGLCWVLAGLGMAGCVLLWFSVPRSRRVA